MTLEDRVIQCMMVFAAILMVGMIVVLYLLIGHLVFGEDISQQYGFYGKCELSGNLDRVLAIIFDEWKFSDCMNAAMTLAHDYNLTVTGTLSPTNLKESAGAAYLNTPSVIFLEPK